MTTADRDVARLARVALSALVEPGNWALWRRVAAIGPGRVFDGLLSGDHQEQALWQAAGSRLGERDPRERSAAVLARTARLGGRVVIPEDDEWPGQLADLIKACRPEAKDPIDRDAAPPLCLWARGPHRLDEAFANSVAVVGARAATGYGAHVAREVGYGLAERGWTVVSGGAYGVDACAHRGALAAGGITVAVLACGVERAYPAAHASLFERIADDGLLISEWPPGSDPFRHRFLIRNRVIAAATRGTVLVEAGARSGARQTLRRAGELGRRQLVVPGPITSAMSVGCHDELRGPHDPPARLVTGVPHILEEVGRLGADLAPLERGPEHPRDRLAPAEWRLLEALLRRKPLSAEQVAGRAGVSLGEAVRVLPSLVLRGLAQRRDGGFIVAPQAASDPRPSPGADGASSDPRPSPGADGASSGAAA